MKRTTRVLLYFCSWVILALAAVVLNIINIDWNKTNIPQGILIVIILGILQGSVMEFPVQTIATLIVGGERRSNRRASSDRFTLILNYNLLALSKDDIDECMETMYQAYKGNLKPTVSAVLVSATDDDELKEYELEMRNFYRALIYDELFREGVAYARGEYETIDVLHLEQIWSRYGDVDKRLFIQEYLDDICDRYAKDFMVVHRMRRVLRKCGQYQDLILLSEGEYDSFTYCDPEYYGRSARRYGEPMFHHSEDVNNILGSKFDYTLVLDGDTGVPRAAVFELLQIAAANPDKGIIQPAIKLHCTKSDTIFMHLESMRQVIYEPITNAITELLGQSGYFGKALIKNRIYIDNVIGSRNNLIERVPVDVLSHDTFEAAILRPYYAGSVSLLEAPSFNYITWNIRERRWNRGEVLLGMYFWKTVFGKPMRWIQKMFQDKDFNETKLRTESKLDFVSSYIAHSALRQMFMKPMLLIYIIIHVSVHLRYTYASIILIMFFVLVFPKFATCTRESYKYVILETIASILQFTPEAIVGCVRIVRAVQANICTNIKWVPQRAVEEDFRKSNPFLSSLKHLWGYSLFALIVGVPLMIFVPSTVLISIMLITLLLLPLYTGITSLPLNFWSKKESQYYGTNIEAGFSIVSRPGLYKSIGTMNSNTFKYDPLMLRKPY